jgi:hypothetical protein
MKHVTCDSGLLDVLLEPGHDFFTGVPASAVKQFIGELHRLPAEQHVPATLEAETVGIAAGAYLGGPKIALRRTRTARTDHRPPPMAGRRPFLWAMGRPAARRRATAQLEMVP